MKNKFIYSLGLLLMTVFSASSQLSIKDSDHYIVWRVEPSRYEVKRIALSTGVTLEYVEQGAADGIPVVLLHGITDSWHSYEATLQYLPLNIRAIAVSLRGHGDSDHPSQGYEMTDFSNDVAAFIREMKLGQVIAVGHSMSGAIVQQLALDHSDLLKGIVLIDSDASFQTNPGMPEFLEAVMKLKDPVTYSFADEFQKSTLANPIDSEWYKILVGESLKVPAHVWRGAMSGLMKFNSTPHLNKITVPVLIVWGDKDLICLRADQDFSVNKIPGSKLIVYEGTGHALHWEKPARFAEDLSAFVKRVVVFNNH
jgi:non-heme chloroperoxidase